MLWAMTRELRIWARSTGQASSDLLVLSFWAGLNPSVKTAVGAEWCFFFKLF